MIRGSILQTFFSFDLRWNVFSGAQLIEKSGIFEREISSQFYRKQYDDIHTLHWPNVKLCTNFHKK